MKNYNQHPLANEWDSTAASKSGIDDWGWDSLSSESSIDEWNPGAQNGANIKDSYAEELSWESGDDSFDYSSAQNGLTEDPWAQFGKADNFVDTTTPERGNGKIKNMARALIEAIKGKIGSPETQDMAKQVARDYGRVALMGALDSSGIAKDGRIRKRGVLKAIFMPKRTARQAAFGAASEVTKKAKSDTENVTSQAKEKLSREVYRRAGPLGSLAVSGLVKLSPI